MMELRDFIELGAKKAGSLTALGRAIGQTQNHMSNYKAHQRPMPLDACVKLADYIGADLRAVIAANELATERKEEKRQFWRPFVENARAASIAVALITVINFVTPSPAIAAQAKNAKSMICIMSNRQGKLARTIQSLMQRVFEAMAAIFPPRVCQI